MLNELKLRYEKEDALRHSLCPPNCSIGFDIITVVMEDNQINFVDTESLALTEIKNDVYTWGIQNVIRLPDNFFIKQGLYQLLCEYSYSHDGPITLKVLATEAVDIQANLLKAKKICCFNQFKEQFKYFSIRHKVAYPYF